MQGYTKKEHSALVKTYIRAVLKAEKLYKQNGYSPRPKNDKEQKALDAARLSGHILGVIDDNNWSFAYDLWECLLQSKSSSRDERNFCVRGEILWNRKKSAE